MSRHPVLVSSGRMGWQDSTGCPRDRPAAASKSGRVVVGAPARCESTCCACASWDTLTKAVPGDYRCCSPFTQRMIEVRPFAHWTVQSPRLSPST